MGSYKFNIFKKEKNLISLTINAEYTNIKIKYFFEVKTLGNSFSAKCTFSEVNEKVSSGFELARYSLIKNEGLSQEEARDEYLSLKKRSIEHVKNEMSIDNYKEHEESFNKRVNNFKKELNNLLEKYNLDFSVDFDEDFERESITIFDRDFNDISKDITNDEM